MSEPAMQTGIYEQLINRNVYENDISALTCLNIIY